MGQPPGRAGNVTQWLVTTGARPQEWQATQEMSAGRTPSAWPMPPQAQGRWEEDGHTAGGILLRTPDFVQQDQAFPGLGWNKIFTGSSQAALP